MLDRIMNWVLGRVCAGCGGETPPDRGFCVQCEALLPVLENACVYCARQLPGPVAVCLDCLQRPLSLERVYAPYRYEGLVKSLILDLKVRHQLWPARVLAAGMTTQLFEINRDFIIVPIPSAQARLRRRGFNPAAEIACCVARFTGMCLARRVLRRVGHQVPQSSLKHAEQRWRNVHDAFVPGDCVMPRKVCLIDDVMTTGASLHAATACCLEAGADHVIACVAARA